MELEGLLAEPETIGGDHLRLALTADEFAAMEVELASLLERWEELEVKKEGTGAEEPTHPSSRPVNVPFLPDFDVDKALLFRYTVCTIQRPGNRFHRPLS